MSQNKHYTDSIFYKIEQTAKYCRFLAVQVFKMLEVDISVDEFAALDVIMTHEGICQRELARLILKDRPNTGRILNSLEERGYVKRYTDKKNNRAVRKMELTQEGFEFTQRLSNLLNNYASRVKSPITETTEMALEDALSKFRQSLEQEVEITI